MGTMHEAMDSGDDCYGYATVHDELKKLTEISKGMLEDQYAVSELRDKKIAPHAMAREKYLALRDNSNTRLLLDGSICINKPCVPMFEVCSTCDFFQPDPKCQEPLEEYIEIYKKRTQELEAIGGNPNTISFIKTQKRYLKAC